MKYSIKNMYEQGICLHASIQMLANQNNMTPNVLKCDKQVNFIEADLTNNMGD